MNQWARDKDSKEAKRPFSLMAAQGRHPPKQRGGGAATPQGRRPQFGMGLSSPARGAAAPSLLHRRSPSAAAAAVPLLLLLLLLLPRRRRRDEGVPHAGPQLRAPPQSELQRVARRTGRPAAAHLQLRDLRGGAGAVAEREGSDLSRSRRHSTVEGTAFNQATALNQNLPKGTKAVQAGHIGKPRTAHLPQRGHRRQQQPAPLLHLLRGGGVEQQLASHVGLAGFGRLCGGRLAVFGGFP